MKAVAIRFSLYLAATAITLACAAPASASLVFSFALDADQTGVNENIADPGNGISGKYAPTGGNVVQVPTTGGKYYVDVVVSTDNASVTKIGFQAGYYGALSAVIPSNPVLQGGVVANTYNSTNTSGAIGSDLNSNGLFGASLAGGSDNAQVGTQTDINGDGRGDLGSPQGSVAHVGPPDPTPWWVRPNAGASPSYAQTTATGKFRTGSVGTGNVSNPRTEVIGYFVVTIPAYVPITLNDNSYHPSLAYNPILGPSSVSNTYSWGDVAGGVTTIRGGSLSQTAGDNNVLQGAGITFEGRTLPASPSQLIWIGTNNGGAWDVNSTQNWNNTTTMVNPSVFNNADHVTFDNSATHNTVNISAAVSPSDVTFNNDGSHNYVISSSNGNGINDFGGGNGTTVTVNGTGSVTLETVNTYTGATTVNSGTLNIGDALGTLAGSVASTAVNVNGGNLNINALGSFTAGGVTATVASGGAMTVVPGGSIPATLNLVNNGTVTFNASQTIATLNGTSAAALLRETGTLTVSGGGSYAGSITDDGPGSLTVSGGTLILAGSNTYTGTTNITAGTLRDANAHGIPNGTTLNFSGSVTTLDLQANSLQAANVTFADGSAILVNGSGGSLTENGANDFLLGGAASGTTVSVDMSSLSTFAYNAPANSFRVGGRVTASGTGGTGTLFLAGANTITALSLGVADTSAGPTTTDQNIGTLHLGQTNVINVNTIHLADGSKSTGTIDFNTGLSSPTVTIRGTAGGSTRANLFIGDNNTTSALASTGTLDLTTNPGSIDAMLGTVVIGNFTADGTGMTANTTTGSFKMGAGTVDATSITLGSVQSGVTNVNASATGTFDLTGGSVTVATMTLADRIGAGLATGTFNLHSGTLSATTITKGAGTGTAALNWDTGTIQNTTGSNLTITGTGSANLSINLNNVGTHTFNVSGSQTATVAASAPISGSNGLVKTGSGTLTLNGSDTYGGGTTVNDTGTLVVGNAQALGSGGLAINNTATTRLQAGLTAPVQLPSLTIAGGTTPTAKLDVTGNNMVLHNGNIATTVAQLKSGLNASGTLWTGAGIQSSTAAADAAAHTNSTVFAVGEIKNVAKNGFPIYFLWPQNGVAVTSTDLLVKYTYFGDANLDGIVDNTSDFDLWSTGYTNPGLAATNPWLYGDFDYSGIVDNTTDYDLWSNGFIHQGPPLFGNSSGAPTVQPVPEPNTVILSLIGLLLAASARVRICRR